MGKGKSRESSRSHELKYDPLAQRRFYSYSYDDSTCAQMAHLRQLYSTPTQTLALYLLKSDSSCAQIWLCSSHVDRHNNMKHGLRYTLYA